MGEARRRRLLGLTPQSQQIEKASAGTAEAGVESSDLLSTKITVRGVGDFKVSIAEILNLKDEPDLLQLAIKLKVIEFDRWCSFCCVENSAGDAALPIAYFAPPYSNVKVGLAWVANGWTSSQIQAIEMPVRRAIALLARERFQSMSDPEVLRVLGHKVGAAYSVGSNQSSSLPKA